MIGIGGAVALLLTARRQRYTELALVHTDRDTTERRITELYTKAADQLGSDQAPVRLAGLYALERLAHSTVEHRQTIVDVICAYLRMPYTPPSMLGQSYRSPEPARRRRTRPLTSRESRQERAEQEKQVRLTAQDILLRNLRVTTQRRRWWRHTPPPAPTWPGIRLNLTGALLLEFSLTDCQLDSAVFRRAQFTGETHFLRVRFTHMADFSGAQFTDTVYFQGAQFINEAYFRGAQFTGEVDFNYAQFLSLTSFRGAQFTGAIGFRGAQFTGAVDFRVTQFTGMTDFTSAQFTHHGAFFTYAQFTGRTNFTGAQFTSKGFPWGGPLTGSADFGCARVASAAEPGNDWPPGWTTRPADPDNGEDPTFLYLTKAKESPDA
ncbi:MAG: pentapeptide repeat-containing protein [Pseudonocardiaceae bacterium]